LASMATQEFTRAVRSIYISVSRSTAAAKAVLELAAPEENEDEAA